MNYYAKIENDLVTKIVVAEKDYFEKNYGKRYIGEFVEVFWYVTGGVAYDVETNKPLKDQKNAYIKNFPTIGFTYDRKNKCFYPPREFESWTLDKETGTWKAPKEYPNDGKFYYWDEKIKDWLEFT
jgi:hypothetical protein